MIESTLATRLGVARQRAGMTQGVLAKALGLGAGSRISDWEAGRTAPTAATMVQIPNVLGVSGHWLLTGSGPMAVGQGNDEARIEAASKILAGEVSEDVVNLVAGRTEPLAVVREATRTAEVARGLSSKSEEADSESVPFLGSRPNHLND
jgi:transcriptional regulator with XRE-family HTH domain